MEAEVQRTTDGHAPDPRLREHLHGTARELEHDAWTQAESHVTAAGFWGTFQWVIGGAAAVLAAVASGTAFTSQPTVAGVLALLGAGAAAVMTALRPGDLAAQHYRAAGAYHRLQTDARQLWEFDPDADATTLRTAVRDLTTRWSTITEESPRIPRRLIRVAGERYVARGRGYFPRPRQPGPSEG